MFDGTFKPRPMQKPHSDGCKIKIRYDKQGRVSGYESNGNCTKADLEAFESKIFSKSEEDREEE